ncbi:MAG: glycosyltransferase family 4 protein [Dehalococcoidia bacterium]
MTIPEIAYLVRVFPKASETFVANEIVQLEQLGFRIHVYSFEAPEVPVEHECVRQIRAPVSYLPASVREYPLATARAHRDLWSRSPARYWRTFRFALRLCVRQRSLVGLSWFLQAGCMANAVLQTDVSHLHCHFAHGPTSIIQQVAMLTGLPYSFSAHAKDLYTTRRPNLRRKVEGAKFAVTCTRANYDYMRDVAGPEFAGKIAQCYHGVDADKFKPAPTSLREEPPLILAAGRLVEKKGFPDLFQACRLLRDRGIAFRCLVVGDGKARAALEQAVQACDVSDVVSLPGAASQEELARLYRQATAFVLPCRVLDDGDRDGIPNVILEAMASGLPVVATSVSGIPEAIDSGRSGLLVPERNPEELAGAIELLLRDEALRERLGAEARRRVVRDFDPARNARLLAELFAEQLGFSLDEPEKTAASTTDEEGIAAAS